MSYTHTLTSTWENAEGRILTRSNPYVGGSQGPGLDESIPDEASDLLVNFALDFSSLQSFYLVSDQVLTIKTNDSGAPDDTFVLVANEPLVWHAGSLHDNPVTVDITKLYVSNASGSAAALKWEILTNPTP